MRVEHEIFQTPYQVTPTLEERPTELSYLTRASGRSLGKTMPMWRVQTEGYKDEKGMLVGVVTPDKVLDDAPDAEYISAGVNTKGCDSVALGRQGSCFHWGFAASPTHMTDEAKLVMVNAIHYISKFRGQRAFVKKRVYVTRADLDDMLYTMSDEGFARWQEMLAKTRRESEKRKQELQKRKDDGEALSEFEEMMLNAPPLREYTRFDLLSLPDNLREQFGEDWEAYRKYYTENLDYLYSPDAEEGRGLYLDVDNDVKQLGIANHDVRLLEKCVSMLNSTDDDELQLAQRLLARYTEEDFDTASQWQNWFNENREYLWLSEISGFKFLVDLNRKPVGGGSATSNESSGVIDDEAMSALVDAIEVPVADLKQPAQFHSVLLRVQTADGPRLRLIVKAEIMDGWHIYSHVPDDQPYVQTTFEIAELDGLRADGQWVKSPSRQDLAHPDMLLWYEQATVYRDFIEDDDAESPSLSVTVNFQVCNKDQCLPPQQVTLQSAVKE